MASRKSFLSKPSYIFPATTDSETHLNPKSTEGVLEFDEADLWNMSSDATTVREAKKAPLTGSRSGLKRGSRVSHVASTSLPVNIPDWSKILKEDYEDHRKRDSDGDVGDGDEVDHDEGGTRIPPHEYLARTRGASLSVHEGRGRTLKGRDLRCVRNAIWKKVGFED